MVEEWLNEPGYETAYAPFDATLSFGVRRKDGKPMTEADTAALLAEARKSRGGEMWRDEELSEEAEEDGEVVFGAGVEFEMPVAVTPGDRPSDSELRDDIGAGEAGEAAIEAVLDMLGDLYDKYDYEWYDIEL